MQNEQELRDLLYEKMCNEQENFIEKLFENIALEEENTSDKGKEEPAESSDSEGEN